MMGSNNGIGVAIYEKDFILIPLIRAVFGKGTLSRLHASGKAKKPEEYHKECFLIRTRATGSRLHDFL